MNEHYNCPDDEEETDSGRGEQERSSFAHGRDDGDCQAVVVVQKRERKKENAGSPLGSSTSGGRNDSSLGNLTKKFLELVKAASGGILDLNRAADKLKVQKRRIYDITNVLEGVGLLQKQGKNSIQWMVSNSIEEDVEQQPEQAPAVDLTPLQNDIQLLQEQERLLDEQISSMSEGLQALCKARGNQRHLYVTDDDITGLPGFEQDTIFAVRAPPDTVLEVPEPVLEPSADMPKQRYRVLLRSTSGPVEVYLVQHNVNPTSTFAISQENPLAPAPAISGPTQPHPLDVSIKQEPMSQGMSMDPMSISGFSGGETPAAVRQRSHVPGNSLGQSQSSKMGIGNFMNMSLPPTMGWAASPTADGVLAGVSPLRMGGPGFPHGAPHGLLSGFSPLGLLSPPGLLEPEAELMEAWLAAENGWAPSVEQYYRDDRHSLDGWH